jgi:hypothetical protein
LQLRLPGDWPVGQHRRALPETAGGDLESVLIRLQEVEINAWISPTPPAHIAAGIHDPFGGDDIREDFHPGNGEWPRAQIARWLLAAARLYYRHRL